MLIGYMSERLAPVTTIATFPIVLILLYLSYQLFLARRKRYLPLTVSALILSFLQGIALSSYLLGISSVGVAFQKLALSTILLFIVFLTQVQWEQNKYEKLTSYVLVGLFTCLEVVGASLLSCIPILFIAGFHLYQIKDNYRATFKTTLILLLLVLFSLCSVAAATTKLGALWAISNINVVVILLAIFMALQDRLVKLLMNSYLASVTDPLTGLYNKRQFQKQLQTEMKLSDTNLYAIFCDIDNFKKLNDSQGHKKGDEALIKVSAIVQEEVSSFGVAARYGGEEIVAFVNLKSSESDGIVTITERIRERVNSETVVTLSIGYARSSASLTYDQLVSMADSAMYFSKGNGKNRITAYNEDLRLQQQQHK